MIYSTIRLVFHCHNEIITVDIPLNINVYMKINLTFQGTIRFEEHYFVQVHNVEAIWFICSQPLKVYHIFPW